MRRNEEQSLQVHVAMWPGEVPQAPRVAARNDNAAERMPMLLTLRFDLHPRPVRWRPRFVDAARRHSVCFGFWFLVFGVLILIVRCSCLLSLPICHRKHVKRWRN